MLFNAKTILVEEQEWDCLTYSWGDKGLNTFLKVINPKVNIIVQLEFELAYYDVTVQHINYYTMWTIVNATSLKHDKKNWILIFNCSSFKRLKHRFQFNIAFFSVYPTKKIQIQEMYLIEVREVKRF